MSHIEEAEDAILQGKLDDAEKICRQAVADFKRTDRYHESSACFHLLGEVAYLRGDLDLATAWYKKALSVDDQFGKTNSLDYAKTCHNLGVVANANGDVDAGEKWVRKSMHIKDLLGDKLGVASGYYQLGIIAESRSDLDAARVRYVKSLQIAEELKSIPRMAQAMLQLARVGKFRGNTVEANEWRERAVATVEMAEQISLLFDIGEDAENSGDLEGAESMYQKALDIAEMQDDNDGVSRSCFRLARVACAMGDYASARDQYKRSIAADESLGASERAAIACANLARIYMSGGNGICRDFHNARRYFRKGLALTRDASSWDFFVLELSLWYRWVQVRLTYGSKHWELIQE